MAAVLLEVPLNVAQQGNIHERGDQEKDRGPDPDDEREEHGDDDARLEYRTAVVAVKVGGPALGHAKRVERDAVDDLTRCIGEQETLPSCVVSAS